VPGEGSTLPWGVVRVFAGKANDYAIKARAKQGPLDLRHSPRHPIMLEEDWGRQGG
jgi:hypothetical protein